MNTRKLKKRWLGLGWGLPLLSMAAFSNAIPEQEAAIKIEQLRLDEEEAHAFDRSVRVGLIDASALYEARNNVDVLTPNTVVNNTNVNTVTPNVVINNTNVDTVTPNTVINNTNVDVVTPNTVINNTSVAVTTSNTVVNGESSSLDWEKRIGQAHFPSEAIQFFPLQSTLPTPELPEELN